MEIHMESGVWEIWLARGEQGDAAVEKKVLDLAKQCRETGQRLVVFRSGSQDLCSQTSALLCQNRKSAARRAAQGQ